MDPILIVLINLILSKILNLKVGGRPPPEEIVRGLGPCGPPGSAIYDRERGAGHAEHRAGKCSDQWQAAESLFSSWCWWEVTFLNCKFSSFTKHRDLYIARSKNHHLPMRYKVTILITEKNMFKRVRRHVYFIHILLLTFRWLK